MTTHEKTITITICYLTGSYSPAQIVTHRSTASNVLTTPLTMPTINPSTGCSYTHSHSTLPTGVTFDTVTNEIKIERQTAVSGTVTLIPKVEGWDDTDNKLDVKLTVCELNSDYSPLTITTYRTNSNLEQTLTLPTANDSGACSYTHEYTNLPTGVTVDVASNKIIIDRSTAATKSTTLTVTPRF